MTRTILIAWATLAASIGCVARTSGAQDSGRSDPNADTQSSRIDVRRDLEATVLEGYQQLTLGNLEAYGDGIARDRDIALVGIAPGAVVVGRNPPGIARDRRPFRKQQAKFYSKNLNLAVAPDLSAGWTYDEISYRVGHLGREASIPIRISSVYQREIDRWVLVLEHMGYALPIEEIIELARAGRLVTPTPVCKQKKCDSQSPGLRRIVESLYSDQKGGGIAANFVSGTRAASRAVLVWPDPDQEYHGREVLDAPELAQLFGPGTKVTVHDYRAFMSPSRKVAWVVAGLAVTTGDGDTIGLRASHVLEVVRLRTNQYAWKIVQVQVSVPLQIRELRRRVFGGAG